MGSKRKGGVCDVSSSSEEDEGSVKRKRPVLKTFRIYSPEYVTSSNRDEKKSAAAKIALNVNTTEREIREILFRELPPLRGKRFKFFTQDGAGKRYSCPCSLQCEGKDHSAEWNGRNIPRAAKSNRTVYILIESTTVEETRSGGVQNDTPTNPVPSDSQLRGSVGQYTSNPPNQKEGRVPKTYQSVSCPDLSLSASEHQENSSVQPLSANHGNDLSQWPTQLTQTSQEQTVSGTEYEKVKDDGGVTEEKDGEGEGRIDMGDEEMQTDVLNIDVASTSENFFPQMHSESGYDTFPSENNTHLPVNPANSADEEEMRNFFVNGSPPLDTNFNRNASLSTPTVLMENCHEYRRPQTKIEKIVPERGDVAGGETFYLSFIDAFTVHDFQVQFGPSTISVKRRGDQVFEGKVPSSSTDGVVEVYLVDYLLTTISNSVHFEYIDPKKAKEDFVEKDVKTPEDLQKMFLLLCAKMGKMNLTSNDTKDARGTNPPGDVKTQALSLFYMIASIAAKLNAMDFFRIIFGTQVGHSVFKSCKDAQTPLEEIARENGHEELARLLEQKHSMYQDYENESDDEVDWKEVARAIEKYQTQQGETAEKKSIPSASSSEQIQGYFGDGESSTSLLSLHFSDDEDCTESTFEDQQTTQESMCREEPCQSTAAEGCPENTLEEQQTIPKSNCREKPDTCQTSGRIARGSIQDGMSVTNIIKTIWSFDQLRMNKAHQIKESQSSTGEKNELANLYLNPPHLAVSGSIIMKSFQMDKFTPKEVSSLRRRLGPFDTAKINPSALYPDRDQTIYNLVEKLDTPLELDILQKLKPDLTGGLKAQKGNNHQETAERELCDAKRIGATVMKTESITSLHSPLHSKVESGVKIAKLAGSASNISLEEQSTEEETSQDARSSDERKSACLSLLRTRRLAYAFMLTSLLIVVVCLVTIFTSRASTKKQTPSTWVETATTSREACSNGLVTLSCEGVTNVNAVHKVQWKIKFPEAGWNEFSYCGKSGMNCVVTRPELPQGIKVLKVSNRSVNLQRVAKNNTNGYAQTMCQVLYSDNSRTSHVHKINFTAKCVRIHERCDLNLTKILQSLVQCERAVDIEWYNINGSKFAYCSTCQDCKKISDVNREHVFWNRLQVTRDSLLLTAIQESDDGRRIRVKVHMKASGKSAGRNVEANMASAHMYTIWIFVNTSRPPAFDNTKYAQWQMKINEKATIPCPILQEVFREDGTFDIVYWSLRKSKSCEIKWDLIASMTQKGTTKVKSSGVRITSDGALEIQNVQLSDSGIFQCTVTRSGRRSKRTYFATLVVDGVVPEKENKSLCGSPVKMAAVDDCQEMQYWNGTCCVPCSRCPRGFGLRTNCTSKTDTACIACWSGYDYSNTNGYESCTLCDKYSNCLPGKSKKIKNCTIFSAPVCDGCEDENYFDPQVGGCVECSPPCSILQTEMRSCTTNHDRRCEADGLRAVTSSVLKVSPRSPHTKILGWMANKPPALSAEGTPSTSSIPLVQNKGLWGGVTVGIVFLVIGVAILGMERWTSMRRFLISRINRIQAKQAISDVTEDRYFRLELIQPESSEPLLKESDSEILPCVCEMDTKRESKLLSSLLERESDLEKICNCLDAPMVGVGHYRAVAQYYGCSYYQIVSVFEKQPEGPSRALIEFLQAKNPDLTVAEFASVVSKKAHRNDVVKLLEEYDLK